VELRAIEEFGELGQAVFDFIARQRNRRIGPVWRRSHGQYAARTGGKVPTSQVQKLPKK
jgi:hypothetical protein